MSDYVHVIRTTTGPTSAPTREGQHWIDTVAHQTWLSVGVSSLGDWLLMGDAGWGLTGNGGTNPSIDFLGTTDNQPLVIRTNNTPVAKIDTQGRLGLNEQTPDELVHLKAHTGFQGSGHRITTYAMTTSDTSWNIAYAFTLPAHCVIQITASAVGYNTTTLTRCSLKKTGTLWRESSIAVLAATPQSDYTFKSDSGYNMRIKTLVNQVVVEVQAHSSELTKWSGSVNFDITIDA